VVSRGRVVCGRDTCVDEGWVSQLTGEVGSIALPRFTSNYSASLPAALSALGMGIAFSPMGADFSGLAPHVYLTGVEHKTVVEVDESGTIAAAGTSGVIGVTAVVQPQFMMTMDHPFSTPSGMMRRARCSSSARCRRPASNQARVRPAARSGSFLRSSSARPR
jgi:hypothetical protein